MSKISAVDSQRCVMAQHVLDVATKRKPDFAIVVSLVGDDIHTDYSPFDSRLKAMGAVANGLLEIWNGEDG